MDEYRDLSSALLGALAVLISASVKGAIGFGFPTLATPLLVLYTYPRLFNLYLDPKESRSYLTRKLAYLEVLREGMRAHLATFQAYPPKRVMELRAPRGAPRRGERGAGEHLDVR